MKGRSIINAANRRNMLEYITMLIITPHKYAHYNYPFSSTYSLHLIYLYSLGKVLDYLSIKKTARDLTRAV